MVWCCTFLHWCYTVIHPHLYVTALCYSVALHVCTNLNTAFCWTETISVLWYGLVLMLLGFHIGGPTWQHLPTAYTYPHSASPGSTWVNLCSQQSTQLWLLSAWHAPWKSAFCRTTFHPLPHPLKTRNSVAESVSCCCFSPTQKRCLSFTICFYKLPAIFTAVLSCAFRK